MTRTRFSGAARVAGVVGSPVAQSLSPLIHNAWIAAAGLDAVYIPLATWPDGFTALVEGVRTGVLAGVNVTIPFKEAAFRLADRRDPAASACGAANLLLFDVDGGIEARNTDGIGLLAAVAEQAPAWRPDLGPVLVFGAGGAARAAVTALKAAGARVRLANRTSARAQALAEETGGVEVVDIGGLHAALSDVSAVVNATAAGLQGQGELDVPLEAAPASAVVMDMVYKPLRTPLLRRAAACGLTTVDGLAMLIGQARPSFEALFGAPAPCEVDVRALALAVLGEAAG